MTDQNLDLLDAIHMAMKAEQKAATFYADASQETSNPLGRRLFEQLAEFERHHYDKLASLEKSLRDEGAFIGYDEDADPPFPVPSEVEGVEGAEEANKKTVMGIITMALDVEQEAEERYAGLAEQTTDPDGQSMFKKLAEEERTHFLTLRDAYWSLNNHGVWAWSE